MDIELAQQMIDTLIDEGEIEFLKEETEYDEVYKELYNYSESLFDEFFKELVSSSEFTKTNILVIKEKLFHLVYKQFRDRLELDNHSYNLTRKALGLDQTLSPEDILYSQQDAEFTNDLLLGVLKNPVYDFMLIPRLVVALLDESNKSAKKIIKELDKYRFDEKSKLQDEIITLTKESRITITGSSSRKKKEKSESILEDGEKLRNFVNVKLKEGLKANDIAEELNIGRRKLFYKTKKYGISFKT